MSLVALFYFLDDRRKGLLFFAPAAAECRFALRCLLAVQVVASLGLLAPLFAGGLIQSTGWEAPSLLCLSLLVLLSMSVIGTLTRGRQGTLLVLLLPLLPLCLLDVPIFLDLDIRTLEFVNPLYYYLKLMAGALAPVIEL